jgi:PAS domain S-box-containing protein
MYSVLYVDDDEILLGLNKIYLEKTGEFSVDIAPTAEDALGMIRQKPYDAIISDYDMPNMNGIEFLKLVRSHYEGFPFLLFTGKGREEIAIEALDNGVDYYIQKGPDMHGMIAELTHKTKRAIERRRTGDELNRSRQQLTDIINFLPDATFVRDTSGKVIAWNKAMEQMTGIAKESILGKGDFAYSLPFYREKLPLLADIVLDKNPVVDSRYQNFKRNGDKITSETFIPHFNHGRGAHLWVTASPLYDSNGTITGAIESFRDISDQYTTRQDLIKSRAMNQGFADIIPVAIVEADLNHVITFLNRVGYELSGMTREDLDRKVTLLDLIAPKDRERAIAGLESILAGKKSTGQEYLIRRMDGSTFPALIYGGTILDPETGKPAGIRGIIIDQTERKKEAQALLEARERLNCAMMASAIGIWDVDMRTMSINDIHDWAFHTLGYQPDANRIITVSTAGSLVHVLDMPRLLFAFYQHLEGKEPLFEAEFRLPHKDGSWRWIAVRGKVIERNTRNEPVRITGTINEITRPVQ